MPPLIAMQSEPLLPWTQFVMDDCQAKTHMLRLSEPHCALQIGCRQRPGLAHALLRALAPLPLHLASSQLASTEQGRGMLQARLHVLDSQQEGEAQGPPVSEGEVQLALAAVLRKRPAEWPAGGAAGAHAAAGSEGHCKQKRIRTT